MNSSDSGIKLRIEKMLSLPRSSHAFMFCGGSESSREEIGNWLASRIICSDELSKRKFADGNYEDFILIEKPSDRESIIAEQIVELTARLAYKPYHDTYVVIIKNAGLMNQTAQNKLLKTLEEPVSACVFILLCERADAMLNTVRSRCSVYQLEPDYGAYSETVQIAVKRFISLIADGSAYYRKKAVIDFLFKEKDGQRRMALSFLDALEDGLQPLILEQNPRAVNAADHVEKAREYLEQTYSTAYTLKQLCLRV